MVASLQPSPSILRHHRNTQVIILLRPSMQADMDSGKCCWWWWLQSCSAYAWITKLVSSLQAAIELYSGVMEGRISKFRQNHHHVSLQKVPDSEKWRWWESWWFVLLISSTWGEGSVKPESRHVSFGIISSHCVTDSTELNICLGWERHSATHV